MATPLEISIACWYATGAGKKAGFKSATDCFENYKAARNSLINLAILVDGGRDGPDYLTEKGLAWVQALTQCQPPTVRYIGHNGMEVTPYKEPEVKPMPVAPHIKRMQILEGEPPGCAHVPPPAPFINDGKPVPEPAPWAVSQTTLDDVGIVAAARARGDIE